MRVTFYSNFLNHHQLPFCQEMVRLLGDSFTFVATKAFDPAVVSAGYQDMNTSYDFCLPSYLDAAASEKAHNLAVESDVIVHGSAPEIFMTERLRAGKPLSFRYSERLYKPLTGVRQRTRTFLGQLRANARAQVYGASSPYLLCAGAYVAKDYRLTGGYKGRAYKWGYFPRGSSRTVEELALQKRREPVSALWAGRMIDWKHGENAIKLAHALKENNHAFRLAMVGDGPCRAGWEKLAENLGVANEVSFLGAVPSAEVLEHMESADIFLFTSDGNEGWGAVLNESMSAGCAVLANRKIGSVPYLLKNGENGLIYDGMEDFLKQGEFLACNRARAMQYGANAKRTIEEKWDAAHAAQAFLSLCSFLEKGKKGSPANDGPCSLA